MERIREAQGLDHVPRPCEQFDLIGGTSTGGYGLPPLSSIFIDQPRQDYRDYTWEAGDDGRQVYKSVQIGCREGIYA
jgi:hypothetical protein